MPLHSTLVQKSKINSNIMKKQDWESFQSQSISKAQKQMTGWGLLLENCLKAAWWLPDKASSAKWQLHTVSFDWFLSGLEWILNLEFCLLKLLIFYQKLLWNFRPRLNSTTFWVFEPAYIWSKSSFFVQKASILIKHI